MAAMAMLKNLAGSSRTLEDTSRDSATEERDGLVEHVASLDVRNDDGIGITLYARLHVLRLQGGGRARGLQVERTVDANGTEESLLGTLFEVCHGFGSKFGI